MTIDVPVLYAVVATLPDEALRDEYVAWLTGGHVQEVIAAGAREARVMVLDPEPGEKGTLQVESRYIFPNREALDAYIRDDAPRLRAEGTALFGHRGVTYLRRMGPILAVFPTVPPAHGERV